MKGMMDTMMNKMMNRMKKEMNSIMTNKMYSDMMKEMKKMVSMNQMLAFAIRWPVVIKSRINCHDVTVIQLCPVVFQIQIYC